MKRLLAAILSVLVLAACEPPTEVMHTMALGEIARAQAEAGDRAEAGKTAARAVETALAVTDDTRGMALGAAAVARTRAGDAGGALALAEGIAESRDRVLAFVLIALAQADAGNEAGAAATLDRALEAAETISKADEQAMFTALAAGAQAVVGDVPGARDSLSEIADPNIQAETLAWVSEIQVETGDTPAALETAQAIANVAGGDAGVLIVIAQAIAVDVHGALDSLILHPEARPRIRALIRVAAAQAEAGDSADADRTTELALEAARAIEDSGARARTLKAVAEAQAGPGTGLSRGPLPGFRGAEGNADLHTYKAAVSGDAWATAELLQIALEPEADPDKPPVDPDRVWIVARLAAALADAGDKAEAEATAELALEFVAGLHPKGQSLPLLLIAAAQARAGDIDGALATAQQIADTD